MRFLSIEAVVILVEVCCGSISASPDVEGDCCFRYDISAAYDRELRERVRWEDPLKRAEEKESEDNVVESRWFFVSLHAFMPLVSFLCLRDALCQGRQSDVKILTCAVVWDALDGSA